MTLSNSHTSRGHATYGASSAHRWMNCPGSVRLSRQVPEPPTSEFAAEGTAAHECAEYCLEYQTPAADAISMEFNGFVVDQTMADHVQLYLDTIQHKARDNELHIEKKFSLDALDPPAKMYGTADAIVLDQECRTLSVIDLKYGQGVKVEVDDNPQLRYYGLGALLATEADVDTIEMVVVQPRAAHSDGPVRSTEIGIMDLLDWSHDLIEAVHAAEHPEAPLNPGSHCKFCPASGVCRARADQALSIAQDEFSNEFKLPIVDLLNPEQIGEFLTKASFVEDWIKALRAHAHTERETGTTIPGWKLVDKRAVRRWKDDEAALRSLSRVNGFGKKDLTETKLLSPAKVDKLMGKEHADKIAKLVTKESSGTVLAPTSDKRPEVLVAASDEFSIPNLTESGA